MDAVPARIAEVWKHEAARLVGTLVRFVGDVGLAEDLAHDALVAALEEWPRTGIPDRPGAWLTTTAKNRGLNQIAHRKMRAHKHQAIANEERSTVEPEDAIVEAMDDDVADDALRLVFIACHPVLAREAQVALTLRLCGGLSTDEIARAFLVPEPTVAQRIVRAKRTLSDANVPFELPARDELGARLSSVLEVVYLVFNEGYAATAGDDLQRPDLVREAIRLARLLTELAPLEPEAHGLLALMELQASRTRARVDERGEPVLLLEQDRSRWDAAMITSGLSSLARAATLERRGPYQLQAAIAACHARAARADDTDWRAIAAIYGELAAVTPSPIVELNRAMAVSRAEGPAAGLGLLDALAGEPTLARYHLYPSARADLLERLGRYDEARAEFERAASMAENTKQRERLLVRAARCGVSA